MENNVLSAEQNEAFRKDGVLLLKGFYNIEEEIIPIQKAIYNIIGLYIKKYDLEIERQPFQPENFDDGLQQILKINRQYASEIYDTVKQIPAFIRLVANPKHEKILQQIFDTEIPGIAAAGYGIRIDHPREDKFRASWHQEFLSQLRSMEGIVCWSPLRSVTEDLGPVKICPGSHVEGVLKVSTTDPDNPNKSGAYALRLIDEEKYLAKYEVIAPLTEPGDLVLLDWHVLHCSGKNISNKSRWSMQMRYFNFDNDLGSRINWCGSFSAGVDVKSILPEYFVD